MNESFSIYNDSAILDRVLVFFGLKRVFYLHFERSLAVKNDVTSYIVNVTGLYVIDDVMKIKLATE